MKVLGVRKLRVMAATITVGALVASGMFSGAHALPMPGMSAVPVAPESPGLPDSPGLPSWPDPTDSDESDGSDTDQPATQPSKVSPTTGRDFTQISPGKMGSWPTRPSRASSAGRVLASEPVNIWPTSGTWQATAQRFTYTSTDSLGNPSVDRALYIEPRKPWKGEGSRPVVAIAPGTQGTGEQCDPSNSHVAGPALETNPPNMILPYETVPIALHLARGAAVVIIDHHRNPETGAQEYVDNIASGQSLLDAAKATQDFGVDSAAPIAIYGYSQGGSASGAAAEMADYYAPELNIKANAVGALPSNLFDVLETVDGGLLAGVLGYAIDGTLSKDPELQEYLYSKHMSEKGREIIANNNRVCIGGSLLVTGYRSTRELTKTGESLAELIDQYPPVVTELQRQRLGKSAPQAPTLLWGGVGDDVIPIQQIRDLRDDWRGHGGNVQYFENELPLVPGNTAIGHIIPMLAHLDYVSTWIWDQLDPNGVTKPNWK